MKINIENILGISEKEIKLFGKVKSIIINNYEYEEGSVFSKHLLSKYIYKYDENGNIIEYNHYKSDGSLNRKRTYKYDENGNIIESNDILNESYDRTLIIRYDKNVNNIEWSWHGSDGYSSEKNTARYDENGNIIEENEFWQGKFTYNYDVNGNEIEWNWYLNDGILYKKHTKQYDVNGNEIEFNFYEYGELVSTKTCKYDENGNTIEDNRIHHDDEDADWERTTYSYGYDENGNIIEKNCYKSDRSLEYKHTYRYEFDEKNNYIKSIKYLNDNPKSIIEREIEYFN